MLAIGKELGNNVYTWWNSYIMGVVIIPLKQARSMPYVGKKV
jgi:hypothetical protein